MDTENYLVCIAGLGLMGGSLARGLKALDPAFLVVEQDDIAGSVTDAVAASREYLHRILAL